MRGDRIELLGVRARGRHGVLDAEKRDGQEFLVDVVLELDLAPAAATDALDRTVNYAQVAADVVAVIEGEPHDLIETVAEQIAQRTLARPAVEAVEVAVHKPQAPVGVPFTDVVVRVRRTRDVPVVIALGANLGDPRATLREAEVRLRRARGLRAVRVSPHFATEAVGGPPQPDYVNAVALARTRLSAAALLAVLHRVEEDFGRTRQVRWGPRTLDLDLIQYGEPGSGGEVRSDAPELTLPHPRAHERAFVLAPWLAVDSHARLRVGDEVVPVADLLARAVPDQVREL